MISAWARRMRRLFRIRAKPMSPPQTGDMLIATLPAGAEVPPGWTLLQANEFGVVVHRIATGPLDCDPPPNAVAAFFTRRFF